MLGGAVAVTISFFVVPERAHALGLGAAAHILDEMAHVLPQLLAGFTRQSDLVEVSRIQNEIGAAVAGFQVLAAEAQRERRVTLVAEPDPAPLSRTLLRLRHDFVIIGRALVEPLPEVLAPRLTGALACLSASADEFLRASARALASRRPPPPIERIRSAFAGYNCELLALRKEGSRTLCRAATSSACSPSASRSTNCIRILLISDDACRSGRGLMDWHNSELRWR